MDIFTLIYPFFPLSPSLWETARYRLKYCLKGLSNPKQPTNQLNKYRTYENLSFQILVNRTPDLVKVYWTPTELTKSLLYFYDTVTR